MPYFVYFLYQIVKKCIFYLRMSIIFATFAPHFVVLFAKSSAKVQQKNEKYK